MAEPQHHEPLLRHWIYRRDGRLHGPMTIRELKAAVALGFVGRDDLVRERVLGRWMPAADVPGLECSAEPLRDESAGHGADAPQPGADG